MANGTVHVQGPDGKHYAFGPQSGVIDEATARAYFQKNGIGAGYDPEAETRQVAAGYKRQYDAQTPDVASGFLHAFGMPGTESEVGQAEKGIQQSEQSLPMWQRLLPHQPGTTPSKTESIANTLAPVLPGAKQVYGMGKDWVEGLGAAYKSSRDTARAAEMLRQGKMSQDDFNALQQKAGTESLKAVPLFGNTLKDISTNIADKNYGAAVGGGLGVLSQLGLTKVRGAGDVLLRGAETRSAARAGIHDWLTRSVMEPAQSQLQDAIGKAQIAEVPKEHPVSKLLNAKTGKEFVETLRHEETAKELDRSLRDLSQSGGLDPQFRQQLLKASERPYDFVINGGGRNWRGVFNSIMAHPILGSVGYAASKAAKLPLVGRMVSASGAANLGETIEASALARELLNKMPPEKPTGFLGKSAGGAVQAKDMANVGRSLGLSPENAKARAIEAVRQFPNDEDRAINYMLGRKSPAPASAGSTTAAAPREIPADAAERAARIARLQDTARNIEGKTPERRTGLSRPAATPAQPAPATPAASAPAKPAADTKSIVETYTSQRPRSNLGKNQRQMEKWGVKPVSGGAEPAPAASPKAEKNYVVNETGTVSAQGKKFDPGSTPKGATHVTVLPNGTLRINAGQQLTTLQTLSLMKAIRGAKK